MICIVSSNIVWLIKAHSLVINVSQNFSGGLIKSYRISSHFGYWYFEESKCMQYKVKRRTNDTAEIIIGYCAGCSFIEMLTTQQVLDDRLKHVVIINECVRHFGYNGTIDGKRFSLDWWMVGAHFGGGSGKLTGRSATTLSENEQEQIRQNLEEVNIPMMKKDVTVTADRVTVDLNGSFGGLRSGLTLGLRF